MKTKKKRTQKQKQKKKREKKKPKKERNKGKRHNQVKNEVENEHKYIFINNYLNCHYTKCSNQNTQSGRLDLKNKTLQYAAYKRLTYGKGHIYIESE